MALPKPATRAPATSLWTRLRSLLTDWKHFRLLAVLLVLGDLVLGGLVIVKVPCTLLFWNPH